MMEELRTASGNDSFPEAPAINFRQALAWLFSFVRPHSVQVAVILLLSLSASSLVLIQPYLTKVLIDDGLLAGNFDTLVVVSIGIFTVGVVATGLSGFNRYLHTRLSGNVLFRLRESVYQHLQKLSPAFYARHRTGDILSRLDGDVAELQRFVVDGLFAAVTGVFGLVGSLAFLFWLNWQLSLVVLVLIPVQWTWLRIMRPKVQHQTRQMRERAADISSFLVETVPAMKFIQTVAAEPREAQRLEGLNRFYLGDLLRLQLVEFATSAPPAILTSAMRMLVFVIGGYGVIQGSMELGSLIAFTTYLGMAVGPVQTLLGLYTGSQRMVVSLERVQALSGAQPDVVDGKSAGLPPGLAGEIHFDDVSFAYPETSELILDHASARFPAGIKIGLYGPSGIGKTTLVDLLLRHYDPGAGSIRIDDHELTGFGLREWRRRIAIVAQDIVLFRGSIMDNIRYACPDSSDADVERVTRQARLDELVARLPQGLQTPVGERGTRLSGGERQRIAIARALLQKPLLLIFDEATSAVDREAERELMAEVDRLFADTTRLIISHREKPLENADLFATIVGGKLLLRDNREHQS
jgi:ATP-binding cassette subfamily B protein